MTTLFLFFVYEVTTLLGDFFFNEVVIILGDFILFLLFFMKPPIIKVAKERRDFIKKKSPGNFIKNNK